MNEFQTHLAKEIATQSWWRPRKGMLVVHRNLVFRLRRDVIPGKKNVMLLPGKWGLVILTSSEVYPDITDDATVDLLAEEVLRVIPQNVLQRPTGFEFRVKELRGFELPSPVLEWRWVADTWHRERAGAILAASRLR